MATEEPLETLFGSCVLEVFTPDTSISFPEDAVDDWLESVKQPHAERRQAFFDEQLNILLVIYIKHPSLDSPHDRHNPPPSLVGLLSHIQVSLDATYISQSPDRDEPDSASLTSSRLSSRLMGRPLSIHPSIFPPSTPNPIPSTTESDRKYVQSEGISLFSTIWGTNKANGQEKFTLLFSESEKCWIAIYQLSLIVSFLRLPFPDPLICLTASTTLRDKALSPSQSAHPFVAYLIRTGTVSRLNPGAITGREEGEEDEEDDDTGFEEINLLEGLPLIGSNVSSDQPLHFPSTRLGNTTRQRLFSLPPVSASIRTPPSSSRQALSHVLRKSYRKVLKTVSGFRVRMRTVFVPHVLLPEKSASDNDYQLNDLQSGNEEREAGNSERTVVLCVEVENSGDSGPSTGFALERLDVRIGGEGTTTRLIGWGKGAFDPHTEKHVFPLRIGSMEQYNLLYVVSFWGTPNDQENFLPTGRNTRDGSELQRSVAIVVHGRPYVTSEVDSPNNVLSYPTQIFTSQWNCILDLSSRPREEPVNSHEASVMGPSVHPEPPSPFPGLSAASYLLSSSAQAKPPQAIAGKRNTLPGSITALRAINPPSNIRLSLPSREHPGSATLLAPTTAYIPPSVILQGSNRSSSPMSTGAVNPLPSQAPVRPFVTPPTPSYPAFPSGLPPNMPHVHALGSQQGHSGPSIDIRREKGVGIANAMPQTPLPTVMNAPNDNGQETQSVSAGEPVIVSVGLLPDESDGSYPFGQRKIYPSNQFTLDIFVYNQSSWTRRFEISCPNAARRRMEGIGGTPRSGEKIDVMDLKASIVPPGILPLQNRVRVGPLKSSTCQSVCMDFLAISPGVHAVDILTLTDIESGYAVNLRSVIDVVVHERIVKDGE